MMSVNLLRKPGGQLLQRADSGRVVLPPHYGLEKTCAHSHDMQRRVKRFFGADLFAEGVAASGFLRQRGSGGSFMDTGTGWPVLAPLSLFCHLQAMQALHQAAPHGLRAQRDFPSPPLRPAPQFPLKMVLLNGHRTRVSPP